MVDLTVLIITKNEENNIPKCIASLRGLAKRIVIVDSFSTDDTVERAKELGADVYQNPFIDHASQINWGLEHTDISTEWVMRIDADEELTEELAIEIGDRLDGMPGNVNGIELKRRVYFLNRWIRHGGVYPTVLLRIFRRSTAYCEQTLMDEHFLLKSGDTVRFQYDLIDNNTKSLEWWINKHNWYSNKEVQDHLEKKKQMENGVTMQPRLLGGGQAERKRWLKNVVYYKTPLMKRAHWYFIYRYFLRLGFLDGKEGLAFHFLQGYWYRFLVDAKIYEHDKMGTATEGRGDLK
jgi:glycosyltransferase involved in cell wall biosynthesis